MRSETTRKRARLGKIKSRKVIRQEFVGSRVAVFQIERLATCRFLTVCLREVVHAKALDGEYRGSFLLVLHIVYQ